MQMGLHITSDGKSLIQCLSCTCHIAPIPPYSDAEYKMCMSTSWLFTEPLAHYIRRKNRHDENSGELLLRTITNHAAFCGTELSMSNSFWVLLEVCVRVKSTNNPPENIRCSAVSCPQLPKQSVAEALKKDVWTSLSSHSKMALKLPLKPVRLCPRAAKCYRGIFDKASHVDWGLQVYNVESESYIAWGFAVSKVTTLFVALSLWILVGGI